MTLRGFVSSVWNDVRYKYQLNHLELQFVNIDPREEITMENLVQGNYSGTSGWTPPWKTWYKVTIVEPGRTPPWRTWYKEDTTMENLVQGNYSGTSGRTPPWRTWYKVTIVETQGGHHHGEPGTR